jgi:SAM-dependent methyltransferase
VCCRKTLKETPVSVTPQTDNEQERHWNGLGGRAWVDLQELLDQVLKPFEDLLVEAVSSRRATCVLDVGCGTGSTTLTIARLLGAKGRCVGIDISQPMIEIAQARAARESTPPGFVCADAQRHPFEPASFDMIISRFGVMFFDDSVQAFSNLRRSAKDDAALLFIAWRGAAENPFMTTAERAAAPLLPNIPPRRPDGPGQFAFADEHRMHRILDESGWTAVDIRPIDVPCTLPEKDLVRYLTRLGPLGAILDEVDDRTRARVVTTVRDAFDPYVCGAEVHFNAACWMVSALAPTENANA